MLHAIFTPAYDLLSLDARYSLVTWHYIQPLYRNITRHKGK